MFAYLFQEKHIFKIQDLSSEKVGINHEGQALGRFIHPIQRSQLLFEVDRGGLKKKNVIVIVNLWKIVYFSLDGGDRKGINWQRNGGRNKSVDLKN